MHLGEVNLREAGRKERMEGEPSRAEVMDVWLSEEVESVAETLQAQVPHGYDGTDVFPGAPLTGRSIIHLDLHLARIVA